MSNLPSTLRTLSQEISALAAAANAATVSITGPRQRPTTGTVVAADRVVAIHHVLGGGALQVRAHDGRTLDASLVGRDDTRDLALLAVPGLAGTPLPTASSDARVGDVVLGASRNWHGQPVVSLGVLGAITGPLRMGARASLERVLRADITSTRGISGGALVSAAGELLGIINAGMARGVPLAVPADEVERSVQALAEHGRIRRGFLGVGLQPVAVPARQHDRAHGLMVVGVEHDGPADRAGLFVGDIIVAAGDRHLAGMDELQAQLTGESIGLPLSLSLLRGSTVTMVNVIVGERERTAR